MEAGHYPGQEAVSDFGMAFSWKIGTLHKSKGCLSLTKTADIFPFLWYTVENIGRRQVYEFY